MESFHAGTMSETCVDCLALRFKGELKNCCQNGKVTLEQLGTYPITMNKPLTGDDLDSKHFRDNIRIYNSAMAFVSMVAQITLQNRQGPYCYRIHRPIHHRSRPQCLIFCNLNMLIPRSHLINLEISLF